MALRAGDSEYGPIESMITSQPRAPDAVSRNPPTVRAIHAKLRHEVITLRLRPTTRLSENELALRFGTSRAPVREALIRLADEGLIDIPPQRGSFVSRISLGAM